MKMSEEFRVPVLKPAKELLLMEAFSQTLAYMNEVRMNDRVKMTRR